MGAPEEQPARVVGPGATTPDRVIPVDGPGGTVNPEQPSETEPQGAPESPRVPGQGPGAGDAGAAQKPGPGLTYDMSAFGPASAPQPERPEAKDGQVRLATVLPVGSFDAGDGLVIDQYGTLCTPEQAAAARTKALHAGVQLKEIP